MKRKILTILALLLLMQCAYVSAASQVVYERADSVLVVRLLNEARQQPDGTNLVIFFARKLLGIPYVGHTLEVGSKERLVVNLRQLDCTTYVENVIALSLCAKQCDYTFKTFCQNLQSIRYRGGQQPEYTLRLHYFTEWIADNATRGLCREVQLPCPPFTATQTVNVNYMSTYPEKYKRLRGNPSMIPIIAKMEKSLSGKQYKYIPKTELADTTALRDAVVDGDIIAIVSSVQGLDIHHVGFAVWHTDGLHLLNASSLRRKTVEESMTLYQYLKRQTKMSGIRIVRLLGI